MSQKSIAKNLKTKFKPPYPNGRTSWKNNEPQKKNTHMNVMFMLKKMKRMEIGDSSLLC